MDLLFVPLFQLCKNIFSVFSSSNYVLYSFQNPFPTSKQTKKGSQCLLISHIVLETSRHIHSTVLHSISILQLQVSSSLRCSLSTVCFHKRTLPVSILPLLFCIINFLGITLGCTTDAAEVKELTRANMRVNMTHYCVRKAKLLALAISENTFC